MLRSPPPAVLGKSLTSVALFTAGTLVYQVGRLTLSLVAAAALGPVQFGQWALLTLIVIYLSAASLGVINGAGREVPFLLGAHRRDAADAVTGASLAAVIVSGLAAAALAASLARLTVLRDTDVTLLLVAAAAALQHPFLLLQMLLRSHFAFGAAAVQLTTVGAVLPVLGFVLLEHGIDGLLLATVCAYLLAVVVGLASLPRPSLRFDTQLWVSLGKVGAPIMLAGLLFGLLTTIDRWLVAAFLTPVHVGLYGLVGLIVGGMLVVPQFVSQQSYPRMAHAFGQGHDAATLVAMARAQGVIAGVLVGAIALGTALIAFVAIPALLPSYSEALLPLAVAMTGPVAYALGSGYGNVLNVIGAHRRFLSIQAVALIGNVIMAVALLGLGGSLVGLALASATWMGLYSMMLYRAARR